MKYERSECDRSGEKMAASHSYNVKKCSCTGNPNTKMVVLSLNLEHSATHASTHAAHTRAGRTLLLWGLDNGDFGGA